MKTYTICYKDDGVHLYPGIEVATLDHEACVYLAEMRKIKLDKHNMPEVVNERFLEGCPTQFVVTKKDDEASSHTFTVISKTGPSTDIPGTVLVRICTKGPEIGKGGFIRPVAENNHVELVAEAFRKEGTIGRWEDVLLKVSPVDEIKFRMAGGSFVWVLAWEKGLPVLRRMGDDKFVETPKALTNGYSTGYTLLLTGELIPGCGSTEDHKLNQGEHLVRILLGKSVNVTTIRGEKARQIDNNLWIVEKGSVIRVMEKVVGMDISLVVDTTINIIPYNVWLWNDALARVDAYVKQGWAPGTQNIPASWIGKTVRIGETEGRVVSVNPLKMAIIIGNRELILTPNNTTDWVILKG